MLYMNIGFGMHMNNFRVFIVAYMGKKNADILTFCCLNKAIFYKQKINHDLNENGIE